MKLYTYLKYYTSQWCKSPQQRVTNYKEGKGNEPINKYQK